MRSNSDYLLGVDIFFSFTKFQTQPNFFRDEYLIVNLFFFIVSIFRKEFLFVLVWFHYNNFPIHIHSSLYFLATIRPPPSPWPLLYYPGKESVRLCEVWGTQQGDTSHNIRQCFLE